MLQHDTSAALLLSMFSPVLVLKPSQQPSSQFTASSCCGPAVLCVLKRICSPNATNLLIERFASDALVSRHTVAANMERRQCPCCMSYKPFQDRAVQTNRRTDLSFSVVLDCTDLFLDGLVCSLNAAVDVTVSGWAFFVHDFGWNVRARFVFGVDDARFMVALQYHFLMTCGQHVVRECSFCVTMTRAFARYDVSKERFHQSVITS